MMEVPPDIHGLQLWLWPSFRRAPHFYHYHHHRQLIMDGFYETQLVVLVAVCFLSLLLERTISQKRKRQLTQRSHDHLESGMHGQASTVGKLARQYLIVYAVVMGALIASVVILIY